MGVVGTAIAVGACAILLMVAGCSSSPPGPTNDYKAKFEKRVGANEQQARSFVDALSGLPAAERKGYVLQHEADAGNLAKVADPQLQKRYEDLVRGTTP